MTKGNNRDWFRLNYKCKALLMVLGFVTFAIWAFTRMVFESSYMVDVNESKEKFGSYTFSTDLLSENEEEKICNIVDVEKIDYIDVCYETDGDENTYIYNIDKKLMSTIGCQLIYGDFPQKKDEILVNRNCLSSRKIDSVQDALGTTLVLKGKKYTISGICEYSAAFNDAGSNTVYIMNDSNPVPKEVYFTVKDYTKLDKDLKKVQGIITKTVYPNWGAYLYLGFGQDITLYNQYQTIYGFVYMALLVAMMFMIYNIIMYCINQQYDTISICNLIGVSKKKSIFLLLKRIYENFIVGGVVGYISAVVCLLGIHLYLYGNAEIFMKVVQSFPYVRYICEILFCVLISIIVIGPLVLKLKRLSPCEFLRNDKKPFLDKKINTNRTYKGRIDEGRGAFAYKMARHGIKSERLKRLVSVAGCCVAICLIVIGTYYVKINSKADVDNKDYSCKIRMYDFYHESQNLEKKKAALENSLGFSKDTILYPLYISYLSGEVGSDKISNNYKGYLYQNVSEKIDSMKTGKLKIPISILGYNSMEMKMLSEVNENLDIDRLQDGECIVLSTVTTDTFMKNTFSNNFKNGDKIKLDLVVDDEKMEHLNIVGRADALPLQAISSDYRIVVIISDKYFEKVFDTDIPKFVYIKDDIEKMNAMDKATVESLELDNDYVIEFPKEQSNSEQRLDSIMSLFIYAISGLMILLSAMIISSGVILRVSVRKNEYAMMKAMGISNKSLCKIFAIENFTIHIEAVVISFVLAYFATKYMLITKYPVYGTYLYTYPLRETVIAIILSTVIWLFLYIMVCWKIKNIDTVREIRSIT